MKPREEAYMIVIDALRAGFKAKHDEFLTYKQHGGAMFTGRNIKTLNAIVRLHNSLLDKSGLDGTHMNLVEK